MGVEDGARTRICCLLPMAEAAQATVRITRQVLHVVADAGYSNGERRPLLQTSSPAARPWTTQTQSHDTRVIQICLISFHSKIRFVINPLPCCKILDEASQFHRFGESPVCIGELNEWELAGGNALW